MNWEAIGAVGEIIGALAVVATLAYLARQLHVQNQANDVAAFEGIIEGFNEVNAIFANDKAKYRLLMTGMQHPDQLDDDEAGQFSFMLRLFTNMFLKAHRAYARGALPEAYWQSFASQAAIMLNTPGGKIFVDDHSDVFVEFFDAIEPFRGHGEAVLSFSMGREHLG